MRAAALFALCLAACATSGGGQGGDARPLLTPTEAPDPGALPVADVPSGRCGTILWAKSGADQVPVFRSVDDGTASMVLDDELVTLTLTGRGGETRVGIPATQAFRGEGQDGPVEVVMRATWGQSFPAGAYVSRATLNVAGPDGWERVMPVAGIAGCRP